MSRKRKKQAKGKRPDGGAPPVPSEKPPKAPLPPPEPRSRRSLLLIGSAGIVVWVVAFLPNPVVLGAIPGLLGWFILMDNGRSLKEIALYGLGAGAVSAAIGYHWLAGTVQRFGDVPAIPSWILVALFGAWNAIHGLLFYLLYRDLIRDGRRPHPLVTVVLVLACETLPIRMFGWMTGHGAVDVAPIAQAAEWGGVPGVSFVMLCLILPLNEWLRALKVLPGGTARPRAALVTFLVGCAFVGIGAVRYRQVKTEDSAADRHLRTAIVQADIGSIDKRQATEQIRKWRRNNIAAYTRGTREALKTKPDLIVWPETAITDAIPLDSPDRARRTLTARGFGVVNEAARDAALLVGMYEAVPGVREDRRRNVAALLPPGGPDTPWSAYRKVYLIPFGEAMPFGLFEDLLPQGFRMVAGPSDPPLLRLGDIEIAAFICYEDIIPDHVRAIAGDTHPDLLVNLTNDSWFGEGWEPHQHLNFARFRAIEHRAPLVRATNTGISAFVDATGDVAVDLGVGREGVLFREIPLVKRDRTLYLLVGHRLPWLLWALALVIFLLARKRARSAPRADAA